MKRLVITIFGIIFVNSLFTLLPTINPSIQKGTLIVYQFYFNSLFILSFFLKQRIVFPEVDNSLYKSMVDLKNTAQNKFFPKNKSASPSFLPGEEQEKKPDTRI